MSEIAGLIVTVVAVWGVLLNNRLRRSCFILWLISNGLSAVIHAGAGMWTLTLRDVIFFGLCIEGFWRWQSREGDTCSRRELFEKLWHGSLNNQN